MNSEPKVDVSIITPVRDEAGVLGTTARTIIDQRFDGRLEFLFVEGHSRDGTRTILERLAEADPRIRLLANPTGDLAGALRVGLQAARGEFVAKMDAHTWFPPEYIQHAVDRLRQGDVHWVSGPPVPHGIDRGSRQVALALGTRLGVGGSKKWGREFSPQDPQAERELDTGVFSGVWTTAALRRFGGWDPDWPVNEDSELAARFLAAGERLVCLGSMAACYLPRNTLRGLARQYYRYGRYRAKTARRHEHSLRRSGLLPPSLVLALAAAPCGRRGATVSAVAAAAYACALVGTSALAARDGETRDALGLPAVFATMHLAFGLGFLSGCASFGLPAAAIGNALAGRSD